jgi:hypothetical protein
MSRKQHGIGHEGRAAEAERQKVAAESALEGCKKNVFVAMTERQ